MHFWHLFVDQCGHDRFTEAHRKYVGHQYVKHVFWIWIKCTSCYTAFYSLQKKQFQILINPSSLRSFSFLSICERTSCLTAATAPTLFGSGVAHWNLLKWLRLRSRPPHPRLTASSNRIFKEATIGIKSRLYKKHSRNLSFPRKHKARLRLTTHTFCLKYRVQTKMQTSLMQVEIKSQVSR